MDELDPIEFVDRHLNNDLRDGAFMLSRQDMRDDWCWVDMLADFGIIQIDQQRFAWQRDLGLDAENAAKMERVRSVLVRVGGGGAYLSINRVKPEVWERICTVIGDPHAHAMPIVLVHEPSLAESIVGALLEDDFDPQSEVFRMLDYDLMPLRAEMTEKFGLDAMVIHVLGGVYNDKHRELHICVARRVPWQKKEISQMQQWAVQRLSEMYRPTFDRACFGATSETELKKFEGGNPWVRIKISLAFNNPGAGPVPEFTGVEHQPIRSSS